MEYPDNTRDQIDVYNAQGNYDGEPFARLGQPSAYRVPKQGDRQVQRDQARKNTGHADSKAV